MIHIIIGTKAQLIKMAPVMQALLQAGIPYRYISTGQHRDTVEDILRNFNLRSADIKLYTGSDITSIPRMVVWALRILWVTLKQRKLIFGENQKGIALVHGDTFSTLLGALMAKIGGLKVGHVESGLRSHNLLHPFPEELTRLATLHLTDYFFCPGEWAVKNIKHYEGSKIDLGANTLLDALELAQNQLDEITVDIPHEPFAIATLHRFENIFSKPALERVVSLVCRIADSKNVVFILHKPTLNKLKAFNLYEVLNCHPNIELRQRYDYFHFIKLIAASDFVISDGGSNQEECYYLGKPILLLRKATERKEGLGENCILSQYDVRKIDHFVENFDKFRKPPLRLEQSPSQQIVMACKKFLS